MMGKEDPFQTLPEELVALVLTYLDSPSLARFVLCTSRRMSSAYALLVREIAIPRNCPVTSADLHSLVARFPNAEALSLPTVDGLAFGEGYALDCDALGKLTRLKKLKRLSVGMYHRSDWSFLAGLQNLEVLIAAEPVPNALLAGMTNLRELRVMLEDESDLSFLDAYPAAQLKQLHLLSYSDNADRDKISRFSALTHLGLKFIKCPSTIGDLSISLTKLQSVALSLLMSTGAAAALPSFMSSLRLLSDLQHVTVTLETQGKRKIKLESTDFLFHLPAGLQTLKMPSIEVRDLSFLDRLPHMRNVAISLGPEVSDCTPLHRLQNLRSLHVQSLPFGEITHLPKSLCHLGLAESFDQCFSEHPPVPVCVDLALPALMSLKVEVYSGVHITFSSEKLPSLKELDISLTSTQHLSFLGQFESLKRLSMESNASDFSFFEHLSRLESLSVRTRADGITYSSFLSKLPNLTHLEMDGSYVNDFSVLANLPLKVLVVTGLCELSSFKSLKRIRNLDIFRCSLSSIVCDKEEASASLEETRQVLDDVVDVMKPRLFILMN